MDWKALLTVAGAGGIGGFAYWIIQALGKIKPFGQPAYLGIPALIVLGAVAAALGVYLVANSDTSDAGERRHTLAFALACGLAWQPVIQSSMTFVDHKVTEHQAAVLQDNNQQLSQAIQTKSPNLQQTVAATASLTTDLLQKLPSVQDPDIKGQVLAQSTQAVNNIQAASREAPQSSIDGLQKIGVVAAQVGETDIATHALANLARIAQTEPSVKNQAQGASSAILSVAQQPVQKLEQFAPSKPFLANSR